MSEIEINICAQCGQRMTFNVITGRIECGSCIRNQAYEAILKMQPMPPDTNQQILEVLSKMYDCLLNIEMQIRHTKEDIRERWPMERAE